MCVFKGGKRLPPFKNLSRGRSFHRLETYCLRLTTLLFLPQGKVNKLLLMGAYMDFETKKFISSKIKVCEQCVYLSGRESPFIFVAEDGCGGPPLGGCWGPSSRDAWRGRASGGRSGPLGHQLVQRGLAATPHLQRGPRHHLLASHLDVHGPGVARLALECNRRNSGSLSIYFLKMDANIYNCMIATVTIFHCFFSLTLCILVTE